MHEGALRRSGDLEVRLDCSCGRSIVARASETGDRWVHFTLRGCCALVDLVLRRLRA